MKREVEIFVKATHKILLRMGIYIQKVLELTAKVKEAANSLLEYSKFIPPDRYLPLLSHCANVP